MVCIFTYMEYKTLITVSTIAETGAKYPILLDNEINIGVATFSHKEGDKFVFDAQLSGKRKLDDYDLKPTVDTDSNELVEFRAVAK